MESGKKSVLFICLGNICRSPMAHAIFEHLVKENGTADKWEVDSAAIGEWHIGKQPDKRALKVLRENGIVFKHAVRQITRKDFDEFDYIFGMDHMNMSDLEEINGPRESKAKVELLGKYDPENILVIPDPYYDTQAEFYPVFDQCYRCCKAFLETFQ